MECLPYPTIELIPKFTNIIFLHKGLSEQEVKADDYSTDLYNKISALPTSKIYTVVWRPPPFSWIKVNTDGASKGNPGPASCGAVFRDFQGNFCGGFSMNLGFQDALYAELVAIMVAVECCNRRGWNHLWIESDSTCALSYLHDDSAVPPSGLKSKWLQCKSRLHTMTFHSSHIFREGNAAADFLANIGLLCSSFTWWNRPPHKELQQLLLQDNYGMPKFRVR